MVNGLLILFTPTKYLLNIFVSAKKGNFLFYLDAQEHEAHNIFSACHLQKGKQLYGTREQKMFTLHAGTPTRQLYPMKPVFYVHFTITIYINIWAGFLYKLSVCSINSGLLL